MTDMNQPIVNNPSFVMTEIAPKSQVVNPVTNNVEGVNNHSFQGNENSNILGNENIVSSEFIKIETAYFNVANYQEDVREDKPKVNHKGRSEFVLTGSIKDIDKDKIKALENHLRKISKDIELTIYKVEEGSIKITVGGNPETLELLKQLFEVGELNELLEFPIEDVQILDKDKSNNNSSTLVKNPSTQEIINTGKQLKKVEQLLDQHRAIKLLAQLSSIRYNRRRYLMERRVHRHARRIERLIDQLSKAEKIIDQLDSNMSEDQLNKTKQLKQQISRAKSLTSTSKEIKRIDQLQ
jgi:hypothetical protein